MDFDQNRPPQSPVLNNKDDISGMNPHMFQALANSETSLVFNDPGLLVSRKLIKGASFQDRGQT